MKSRALVAVVLIGLMVGVALAPAADRALAQASPVAAEAIQVTGLVDHPQTLTVADLQQFPSETVEVSFQSGEGSQEHSYTGVRLAAVIERAGIVVNPDQKNDILRKYLVFTAKDGYEVVISWGEVDPNFGNAPYLLTWEEDGQPLTGEAGPIRLVTPGDVRGGRYVTGVVTIEIRDVDSAPRG